MASIHRPDRLVVAYGMPIARLTIDGTGWSRVHGMDGSPIGAYSTTARALWALDQRALQALYPAGPVVLLDELRRGGITALDDDANLRRLRRCAEGDVRRIASDVLARGWRRQDVAALIAEWRHVTGRSTDDLPPAR